MKIVLTVLLFFSMASCAQLSEKSAIVNEDGIAVSSMPKEGIDSTIINALTAEIQKGVYPNIHSLLIARNNKLVYENYWAGVNLVGTDPPLIQFTKDNLHDMRSVSKSFVSACVGIAIAQGKIKSVEQKIFEFFPGYAEQDTGLKSQITIKDLLTMTAGLQWNEKIPYTDPKNSEVEMDRSDDPIGYVLTRPMQCQPGTVWNYSGGATQLLGCIIEKATGKKLDAFADEYLFQPLGIKKFQWKKFGAVDLCGAAWGLRLRPRDMMKFGMLYANKGNWNGKQIIPETWIDESLRTRIKIPADSLGRAGYGYQFWTWSGKVLDKLVDISAAVGNGDQNIFIDKTNKLIVVATAGNYDRTIEKNVDAMLGDYIYRALKQ